MSVVFQRLDKSNPHAYRTHLEELAPRCPKCGRRMIVTLDLTFYVCVADRDDHVLGIRTDAA